MLDAATALPLHPDPDRVVSARPDPAGMGKILHLLRTLSAYGKNLVEKLRQEDDLDDLPWYAFLTSLFGTTNPALITVVVIRGLLRAAVLQARLSSALARGSDSLLPIHVREGSLVREPRRRQPRAAGWTIPQGWPTGDPSLEREPAPEEEMFAEIAARDRDRPIGAILLDICLDLGIVPALMDPATWDELRLTIALYGGDPARLLACGLDPANPPGLTDTGTPAPGDSLPIAGQPTIAYPPWPAPPEQPPPPTLVCFAAQGWGKGPGP